MHTITRRAGGIAVLMAALVAAPLAVRAQAPPPAAAAAASPEARADAILSRFTPDRPGLQALVVRGGQVIYERNLGAADLEHAAPVTAATRFHVASVSKQFTAFAVLQLARAGKVDLDADIHAYLPELADFGTKVTVSDLVHHTSGLRDQWELEILSGTSIDSVIRQKAILAMAASQKGLNFPPGTDFRYSNTGYSLLAEIVARVSKQPFKAYMREHVFAPLGMSDTLIYDDVADILPNRAMSYAPGLDGKPRISRLNYANYGATSLTTTARDLAKWSAELMHPKVFDAAMVREAEAPGRLRDGRPLNYGFGMLRDTIAGHAGFGHGGADAGYRAYILSFPAEDATVVVLSNGAADTGAISEGLVRIFLGDGPSAAPKMIAADPATFARLAGYYVSPWGPGLELKADGDRLVGLLGGMVRQPGGLLAGGGFYLGAPANAYRVQPDGSLAQWQQTGGLDVVYRRAERVKPQPAALKALEGAYRSDELDVTYKLAVVGDHVVLTSLRNDPVELYAADADHFENPQVRMGVLRDKRGRPAGLEITTGRIRNLPFRKL
jgi:CubicO group peptidase (beta-lactamase class C family)